MTLMSLSYTGQQGQILFCKLSVGSHTGQSEKTFCLCFKLSVEIFTCTCTQRNDEELLQKAIIYEAERGFPNSVGQTKRYHICQHFQFIL